MDLLNFVKYDENNNINKEKEKQMLDCCYNIIHNINKMIKLQFSL